MADEKIGNIPVGQSRKIDFERVFGKEGHRNKAQDRVWKELVMDPLLTTTHLESKNPRTARDMAILVYNTLN